MIEKELHHNDIDIKYDTDTGFLFSDNLSCQSLLLIRRHLPGKTFSPFRIADSFPPDPMLSSTVLPLILKPASFADTAHKNFPLLSPFLPEYFCSLPAQADHPASDSSFPYSLQPEPSSLPEAF